MSTLGMTTSLSRIDVTRDAIAKLFGRFETEVLVGARERRDHDAWDRGGRCLCADAPAKGTAIMAASATVARRRELR